MGIYIKLYKKIITSVKIISKPIFKFQLDTPLQNVAFRQRITMKHLQREHSNWFQSINRFKCIKKAFFFNADIFA